MKYRIADMVNGPYSEIFDSIEAAKSALAEEIAAGKKANLEASDGETDLGTDGTRVEEFFCIVDAETGEEI